MKTGNFHFAETGNFNFALTEQLIIFNKLKNKELSQSLAAKILDCTTRWIRKKMKRFLEFGDKGLAHNGRGIKKKETLLSKKKELILSLFEEKFKGFGPTFAAEKLWALYGIRASRETMRKFMIHHGLWIGKLRKTRHRKRRERMACVGIMVQLDGSPHDWFEGRAGKCTLLVFIDDATSRILWLEFVGSESLEAVAKATKNYIEKHGRPVSFYVDYGSVFSVNTSNPDRDKITQFERACKELGIKIIHASSPQAKGRVERANGVMQDRLVKEMRLRQISSIEQANKFAQEEFIIAHNEKFAVLPADAQNAHRSTQGFDLKNIFCIKAARTLANDFTIAYKNKVFQLLSQQKTILRPKDKLVVNERLDGNITLWIRQTQLEFIHITTTIRQKLNPIDYVRFNIEENLCEPALFEQNKEIYDQCR